MARAGFSKRQRDDVVDGWAPGMRSSCAHDECVRHKQPDAANLAPPSVAAHDRLLANVRIGGTVLLASLPERAVVAVLLPATTLVLSPFFGFARDAALSAEAKWLFDFCSAHAARPDGDAPAAHTLSGIGPKHRRDAASLAWFRDVRYLPCGFCVPTEKPVRQL
jgi:hypothetical protein